MSTNNHRLRNFLLVIGVIVALFVGVSTVWFYLNENGSSSPSAKEKMEQSNMNESKIETSSYKIMVEKGKEAIKVLISEIKKL